MTRNQPIRSVVIGNKRWKFVRRPIKAKSESGHPVFGLCDPPDAPNKTITVEKRLRGKLEMDTTIHEVVHAALWEVLAEEFVERMATDITNVLWRMGYRKPPEHECQDSEL